MKSALLRPLAAAAFLLLVCLNPASALDAASSALAQWALSVAPALLPFLIAAPALTSPEACAFLGQFTGSFLRLMRLPAHSTGPLLVGLLSGSPAGAAALSSMPRHADDAPGALLRAAVIASGASPAFLLTGIAAEMLNAPEAGWLLLRSQILSGLLCAFILRSVGTERPVLLSPARSQRPAGMLAAMQTLLTVGGCMALFSILSRQLSLLLGASFETPLLALLELAGGCRALCALPASLERKLPLISAVSCFGGLSVFTQSMSFLSPLGVHPIEYIAGKLIHAALAACLTALQLSLSHRSINPTIVCLLLLSLLLLTMMADTALQWRRKAQNTASHDRKAA